MDDAFFTYLRQKLDVLGYTHSLPPAALPLVSALFEDLVKTTESLRDAKQKVVELLEEKSCWELGVEPYKCDNTRLLTECNQLHMQALKESENFEERAAEFSHKIRTLQSDKLHLEEHCQQLQQQLKTLLSKQGTTTSASVNSASGGGGMRNTKEGLNKIKKPFITTVRSGDKMPPLMPLTENFSNIRCSKCNAGYYTRPSAAVGGGATNLPNASTEIQIKLENNVKDLEEQVAFYKRKVEARDREIRRLNELLVGGRPPAALAKDCCFKDVGALSEDIELLQREKTESLAKIRDYQDRMHEAMQRALQLETQNRQLQRDLEELKDAALQVETQANTEIAQREREVEALQLELQRRAQIEKNTKDKPSVVLGRGGRSDRGAGDGDVPRNDCGGGGGSGAMDKRRINERLNELTQKESEAKMENERLQRKIQKIKSKMSVLHKELHDKSQRKDDRLDEEKIRLKSERDFFQKEYLRQVSKAGSEKEIEFLQMQIKSKDEELRFMRAELCARQQFSLPNQQQPAATEFATKSTATANAVNAATETNFPPLSQLSSARSSNDNSSGRSSECVQAVVQRAEREANCARAALEKIRCERDTLRERNLCLTQLHAEEKQRAQQKIDTLEKRAQQIEREKRELSSARQPSETQIVLLKEEIDALKDNVFATKEENSKLRTSYAQLKILHEQTERSLIDSQNKLTIAESKLESTDLRLSTLNTNRETTRNEATQMRSEIEALKRTYVTLESEKDKILSQLDSKTEQAFQLEIELKSCKEKRNSLEKQVNELEQHLENLSFKTRERDTELTETSAESKILRQQIAALKSSRDKAITENGRLSNDLAQSQAEILTLKKQLKDSEMEIERLKQQLRQYVQEVKKAEDLLSNKEKEREEMLEHYRSLSHDAVLLEGNNQSLEVEAAECKRQICELEAEIEALKKEVCCRNAIIEQLEDKLAALATQNTCLERQLEEAFDDQRLLKVDLAARKELCDKLDIQKDKLNAEVSEFNEIRRKLESDNEKLRSEVEKAANGNKVSEESLEELLSKTRRDLEEQIQVDSKLSQELVHLRQKNDQLLKDLDTERQRRQQHETLAHEYQVQNLELRHNMTDDRFRQARSREQSPRFPTQTM